MPSSGPPVQPPTPSANPPPALNRLGEEFVRAHFHRLGFTPLDRNERVRYGEIALIAFDGHTLVFAEIKTRRIDVQKERVRPDPQPLAWLRPRQRARLRRLAATWLQEKKHIRPATCTVRFDMIGVILDTKDRLLRLDHIEGAW
jgi:putative endonuclease